MLGRGHMWSVVGAKMVTLGPLERLVRALTMNLQAGRKLEDPWAQSPRYSDRK